MPLIKAALKQSIKQGIRTDLEFKAKLFKVAKDSMDNFQSAQKQAQLNAGSVASFIVAQKVASIAFSFIFAVLWEYMCLICNSIVDYCNYFMFLQEDLLIIKIISLKNLIRNSLKKLIKNFP